jgi:CheY-like chemotaxis protein
VILLADDSEIVLSTLGDFLRAQAYQVVVARHGGEALEKARQLHPAVILMDIQMPVIDGLEAIRRLRAEADPGLAATPVIALTALAMSGDLDRCLAAGANAYVPKPVNLEKLIKLIKTCLRGNPG